MIDPPPRLAKDPFTLPCGSLAWHIEPVDPQTSIQMVCNEMVEQGVQVLPVVSSYVLVGAVSERSLLQALADGAEYSAAIENYLHREPATILNTISGSEALRKMHDNGLDWIIVVDQNREPVGILTPSRFVVKEPDRTFKGRVGGMATPYGVYLTNGVVSGGPNKWALVVTGAIMSLLFHLSATLVLLVQNNLPNSLQHNPITETASQLLWMFLFFVGLRSLPLAGTHGAEHMVVHALERGEELLPDVVKRMPRVHPRCGTNLAVGAMVFLGVFSITAIKDEQLRLLLAILLTVILWQPLGSLFQLFVTTKPPTDSQVKDAIRAAEQLKQTQNTAISRPANIFMRLLMSGMFQVMFGGILIALLVALIYEVLKIPAQWRVS